MTLSPITFSFVIPVYNEEEGLPEFYKRLSVLRQKLEGRSQVIFVDDGSSDDTLGLLRSFCQADPAVHFLSFARNFGHQMAVTAGLGIAEGQAVIVMDSDLQDPPEVVFSLVEKWREGYQVVYARYLKRQGETYFKRWLAKIFYKVIAAISEISLPQDSNDFCLMDAKVVRVLNRMPEKNRYLRGLRTWVGFRQTEITFLRQARFAGEAKYSFKKSLGLAMNGMISFSKFPLRIAAYLGLFLGLTVFIAALFIFIFPQASQVSLFPKGLSLMTLGIFFLGAIQLFCLGILGEYVGRIYDESRKRPPYVLKETGNLKESSS